MSAKDYIIAGRVIYEDNTPLVGGMIANMKSGLITITNKDGEFSLKSDEKDAVIKLSYVGIGTVMFKFKDSKYQTIIIKNGGKDVKIASDKEQENYQNYIMQIEQEIHSPSNVALRKPCFAKNTLYNSNVMYAFDGDKATSWTSVDEAPCYIDIELLEPTEISNIRLFTNQNQSGEALYDVAVSTEAKGNSFKSIDRFLASSSGNDVIRRDYSPTIKDVMQLRIEVIRSPATSISFSEIVVNGTNAGTNLYGKNQNPNCVAGDCLNGTGIYKFDNYDTYEGLFKNGAIASNFGVYRWNDGRFFFGLFKNGNLDQGFIYDRNNNPISKVENGQTVQDNSSLKDLITIGSAIVNGVKSLSGGGGNLTDEEDELYMEDVMNEYGSQEKSTVSDSKICNSCKGTGIIPCKYCNGLGKVIVVSNGKELGEKLCHACAGTGKGECTQCKGSGVCKECDDKGLK